jgi:hypothetical protein
MLKIISAITRERERQECSKQEGEFSHTCSDKGEQRMKLYILLEEVRKLAMEVYKTKEPITSMSGSDVLNWFALKTNVTKQLVRVSAICVAWLESLQDEGFEP